MKQAQQVSQRVFNVHVYNPFMQIVNKRFYFRRTSAQDMTFKKTDLIDIDFV